MSFLALLTTPPITAPYWAAPPTGTPEELMHGGIDFFSLWIARIGGVVALIGMIKFALGIKSENAQEMISALLTAISGFIIMEYVTSTFSFTGTPADAEFKNIMTFAMKWVRRVGAFAFFWGALSFGFAIKDNNAASKVTALKTIAAGGVTIAVQGIWTVFFNV